MAEALASTIEDDPQAWEQFVGKLFYEPVDLQQTAGCGAAGHTAEQIDQQCATRGNRTFISPFPPSSMAVAAVHWPTLAC